MHGSTHAPTHDAYIGHSCIRVRRATDLDPAVVTELLREAVARPPGELR
jgi:hypothetical protein